MGTLWSLPKITNLSPAHRSGQFERSDDKETVDEYSEMSVIFAG